MVVQFLFLRKNIYSCLFCSFSTIFLRFGCSPFLFFGFSFYFLMDTTFHLPFHNFVLLSLVPTFMPKYLISTRYVLTNAVQSLIMKMEGMKQHAGENNTLYRILPSIFKREWTNKRSLNCKCQFKSTQTSFKVFMKCRILYLLRKLRMKKICIS